MRCLRWLVFALTGSTARRISIKTVPQEIIQVARIFRSNDTTEAFFHVVCSQQCQLSFKHSPIYGASHSNLILGNMNASYMSCICAGYIEGTMYVLMDPKDR